MGLEACTSFLSGVPKVDFSVHCGASRYGGVAFAQVGESSVLLVLSGAGPMYRNPGLCHGARRPKATEELLSCAGRTVSFAHRMAGGREDGRCRKERNV